MQLFFLSLSVLLFSACGRSTDEIKAQWDEEVAAAIACKTDNDCDIIIPGCPLDCSAVINKTHKERLEAKAKELREEANSLGMSCSYSCILPRTLACEDKNCVGK